jgi:hypothetical protein
VLTFGTHVGVCPPTCVCGTIVLTTPPTLDSLLTGATMKRAGKIGRYGRAAIVAALGVGFVLLAIPAAGAASNDQPTKVVRHLPEQVTDGTLVDWE